MTLVSIIVPSFNQGRYIRETLDSILSQEHRPLEILVIDGASTDSTVDVLRSYGDLPELQWWSEPDKGVVDAVNKGLARARGEIVGIQSSDDLYLPGAIAAVVAEFEKDPEAALLYGDVEYIDGESRFLSRTSLPPFDLHQYIGKMTYIPQPSAFFRAAAMREAGEWRADVSYAADAEFFLRIARRGKVRKIDRALARYRYHEAQRDKETTRVPRDWEKTIEPLTRDRDRRTRRMARGSIWLTRRYYTPQRQWARRAWYAYRMAFANPELLQQMDKRDLIAGWEPLRGFLSRGKRRLGAVVYDWPRFATTPWPRMRNRNERITVDEATGGVRCEWQFTSDLHIAGVYSFTARWLMNRALRDYPIAFANAPRDGTPRVSFIIGHRGTERIPLLMKTLATIAAQDIPVECIVVEQSTESVLQLPDWVRHLHTPVAEGTPYNRSATFNAGAEIATAPRLVLHDNDMLVPERYASELVKRPEEFVDLKRFIFYLSQAETARVLESDALPKNLTPERVMQNAHGGSIAADREAFFAIGGFDESFAGWGGEDNEFWERAETRSTWAFGYLPLLHLWHPSQREKESFSGAGVSRLRELEKIPAAERIAALRQKRSK